MADVVDDAAVPSGAVENGHVSSDEDEETATGQMRPVDIEQDMREMERRKRVEAIMSSKLFREELERVVVDSITADGGNSAAGISSLLSDMMSKQPGAAAAIGKQNSVIPINDIRGLDGMGYTKAEKALRCKLAAVYRLIDINGWTQGIYNHVTARVSQDTEHFLLNPFGMLYNEITASSLVKVDMQGGAVEGGTTNFGINVAGFMVHSAIHAARPDLKCVLHVHMPSIVAVSALKCGLLPLSQEACLIGDISYHAYEGLVVDDDERATLARDLGVHNKVMLLRNHGAVCCGQTIEEAFYYAYHLVLACDTQLKMMPLGLDNLSMIDDATRRSVFERAQRGGGGVNSKKGKAWGVGQLEFEALMRQLDNAGYRTGYVFANPLVRQEPLKPKSDVELPPAVSSLGYLLEEENMYKDGPLKTFLNNLQARATGTRNKWINSPNVYQKVEILETGTPDPKKITKWVSDGSPSHSTPIKIESPTQFVPLNTNKKEFKKIQKAMKEGRRAGGITAGPESKILEGPAQTWDEARGREDANASYVTGDHIEYKVGAASKGIIQRDYQHHATVFKSAYAKNPFDNVTHEELQEYQRVVDSKSRAETLPASPPPPDSILDNTTGDEDTSATAPAPARGASGAGPNVTSPLSPTSPTTDTEHDDSTLKSVPATADSTELMPNDDEGTYNDETDRDDGNRTFSEGEADTSRATDAESSALSPKKEKKKKSGLRTPSFLKKKKKDKKKEKEKA